MSDRPTSDSSTPDADAPDTNGAGLSPPGDPQSTQPTDDRAAEADTGDVEPEAPEESIGWPHTGGVSSGGTAFRAFSAGFLETGSVRTGQPLPLGAQVRDDGVNFAVFSRHATQVWLEIYDAADAGEPTQVIGLDPENNRTGDIWHVWVQGVRAGDLYAYRVDGPYAPDRGHRFNPHKLLLDPYATAITHVDEWDFRRARGFVDGPDGTEVGPSTSDNAAYAPKCVVTQGHFDWEGDTLLKRPWEDTVIYETHVRGFTQHPSSRVEHPGTYRGLVEKIDYLCDLGVTAVELMPVQEFNEAELDRVNPVTGEPLFNYWGYNPTAFMAPNGLYSAAGARGQQVLEFKQMVKALHAAGIEVILDVVFNHTAEGNHRGPTFGWRGIDNSIYYLLNEDGRTYRNYSGTGNTVKADHPIVRDQILDALRYWVLEMHVDGFRFDLASVLGRDQDGSLLADPPLIERIAEDPILRDVKIIAEAWDAAGAYQVGHFSRHRWVEWNGRFRDDVRRFWRGDAGLLGAFASRLAGSSDLYAGSGRGPCSSINFVTSHDGFTLNDLVSYNRKHNRANGEGNRDGDNDNHSANYGVEGPTSDPTVVRVRQRQVKNFLLTLLVSRGVPMLLGGDEFRRTQRGNNNAYCQDNATTWYDWTNVDANADLVRFVREAIALRRDLPSLRSARYYRDDEVTWMDARGRDPDWNDPTERCLGMYIHGSGDAGTPEPVLLLFNADVVAHRMSLPPLPAGRVWTRRVDTARPAPDDIRPVGEAVPTADADRYTVAPRSSVVLVAGGGKV